MLTPEAVLKQLNDLLHKSQVLQKSSWEGDAGKGQNQRKQSEQANKSVKEKERIQKTGKVQGKHQGWKANEGQVNLIRVSLLIFIPKNKTKRETMNERHETKTSRAG